jgi:hypothetical protein
VVVLRGLSTFFFSSSIAISISIKLPAAGAAGRRLEPGLRHAGKKQTDLTAGKVWMVCSISSAAPAQEVDVCMSCMKLSWG